jgi:hypothetical protein
MDVTCLLRDVDTLVVELEGHLVLAFLLILLSDLLVDTDEILQNFDFNTFEVGLSGLLESSLEFAHGFKLVHDIFFTVTKSFVSQGLSLEVLEIQGHVEAALVEIRGGAEVLLLLVTMGYRLVSFEALFAITFTPVDFSIGQVVTELNEVSFDLLLVRLRSTGLNHFEFLEVGLVGLNEVRSSLLGQIKEVDVCLHITFTQKPFRKCFVVDLLVKRKTFALFKTLTVLSCLLESLAVLLLLSTLGDALLDFLLGSGHENFLLLLLRTFLVILHSSMRIDYRFQFHFLL